MGVERLHLTGELIDALRKIGGRPVAGGEPFHALFRFANRRLQRLHSQIEGIELAAFDGQTVGGGTHELGQSAAIVLESR